MRSVCPVTTHRAPNAIGACRGRIRRIAGALLVFVGCAGAGAAAAVSPAAPAFADGPAPCSVGGPPFPFAGFCATYSGDNTWYGSYGPGFPTVEGWGFCADPPASGGDYPVPAYDYVTSSAPTGATTAQAGALGFAFSEAQALGWWDGSPGHFTSDQAAAAGKILYDAVTWGSPVPSMDPGVLAAYDALNGWEGEANGASGAPILTMAVVGGGSSFTGEATDEVQARFPGSNAPASGLPIDLSITGASFNGPSGPDTISVSTDATGTVGVTIVAPAAGTVSVTATAAGGLGQPGLQFLSPSAADLRAQSLVAFPAPSSVSNSQQLTALPTTGTVSIVKGGDDTAYYPVSGAVFQVLSGSTVEDTLTIGEGGATGASQPLPAGSYLVHELATPAGYQSAPDQTVTVVAGSDTEVSFTGRQEDHVIPATLTIAKQDADTAAPLAGAVFEIHYDSTDDGTFDQDLGSCTTTPAGSCSPPGNDGPSGLLPGRFQVTETVAPPGYGIPIPTSQIVDLVPGETGAVTFGDPKLVRAVFEKTATGNVNPAELSLAGVVILIEAGSPGGPSVAECTSDSTGVCATGVVLVSGQHYCWSELSAPPGLAGGADGCFTADDQQANQPITVSDAGKFVAIDVKKLDAANLSIGLPGAVFDLYRVPGASTSCARALDGPAASSGDVLVATSTTGADGVGTFPLQLPGYAYCAVEVQAPANYVADTTEQCTAVLSGTTAVRAPVTTLSFEDAEQTVGLSVFKYNALAPATVIPGATYDLYVEGTPPPSGVPGAPPANAASEPGDAWYARGTTGSDGRLSFNVPAGYAWCVVEINAPPNYVLDGALHCSGVLTTSSSTAATTIAVPETLATVHITAYKYNSHQPDTVIPGATYELVANSALPPGAPNNAPADAVVPSGDFFWSEATTDGHGVLTFAVPAGFSWCLHELLAPASYQPDPAFHCTAVLTADSTSAATTVAVPEIPLPGSLAFTGLPSLWLGVAGGASAAVGAAMMLVDRRRRRIRR